ncbi:hypothetical protein ACRWQM_14525 [Shewanella sp. HL-SH5]|uniref:hypothetical protein n=1 Tax=Shewanella sp. HL-SH5 TaxID=3436241 RepID=UPI003EB88FCC
MYYFLKLFILVAISTNVVAKDDHFKYYSLNSGEVSIYYSDSKWFYYEAYTADLSELETCNDITGFKCLVSDKVSVVVPIQLSALMNTAKFCNEPQWKFKKYQYYISGPEDHSLRICDDPIPQIGGLFGLPYEGIKINTSYNGKIMSFIWSIDKGLIAFTDSSGAEFWLKSKCGFGSLNGCDN